MHYTKVRYYYHSSLRIPTKSPQITDISISIIIFFKIRLKIKVKGKHKPDSVERWRENVTTERRRFLEAVEDPTAHRMGLEAGRVGPRVRSWTESLLHMIRIRLVCWNWSQVAPLIDNNQLQISQNGKMKKWHGRGRGRRWEDYFQTRVALL